MNKASKEEEVALLDSGKELCLILKGERRGMEEEEQTVGRAAGRWVSWKIGI